MLLETGPACRICYQSHAHVYSLVQQFINVHYLLTFHYIRKMVAIF